MDKSKYEMVIGLEVHVQLGTQSKAFCADSTTFGAPANTQTSTISLAHPGTLPYLNTKQVDFAIKLGLALGSKITTYTTFDRKNYFYADLPKGYQITQDAAPICVGGQLDIRVGDGWKKIKIHHIHMEEDAGKSMHDSADAFSRIDLNRAGVPLLEVVTEPDLRSAEEVDAFMTAMRQLVRYLGISDGNMEQGSMRCDCNISIRKKGVKTLGNRCEVKNLNSMRYARKAIGFEFKRQVECVERGEVIRQQTLNFDPATGVTSPLRDKEDAHDYRYFPEPDLPPVKITKEQIQAIQSTMPRLPRELFEEFTTERKLSAYDTDILISEKAIADYFLSLSKHHKDNKAIANLIINKIKPYCHDHNIEIQQFPVKQEQLAKMIVLIKDGKISNAAAYQKLLPAMIKSTGKNPLTLAQEMNLLQSDDGDFLTQLVDEVIAQNTDKVKAYQNGKKGLLGFFMGEVMKRSQGKAAPKTTNELLRKKLEP